MCVSKKSQRNAIIKTAEVDESGCGWKNIGALFESHTLESEKLDL